LERQEMQAAEAQVFTSIKNNNVMLPDPDVNDKASKPVKKKDSCHLF
jgi:hypothetical protein